MSKKPESTPLVSIIIPTYNRLAYLQSAIASVLQQTLQDFEIIVADDCSLESPRSLIEKLADPRIQLLCNSINLGIAKNITQAVELATGTYVAVLNDDDIWQPQFLEKLLIPLEANPDLVLAFCDYWVMDANGDIGDSATERQTRKEKRDRLHPGIHQPFWEIGLLDQAVFTSGAAVLRRSAIAWEELPTAGVFWDYYLAYLACRSGAGAYYISERLMQYRIHPDSENMLSGNRDVQAKIRKGKAGIACHTKFAADAPAHLKPYFLRELAHANTTLAIGLMRDRNVADARPYLWRSLGQQFWNLRTLLALGISYIPPWVSNILVHLPNPGVVSKAR
jgi:glycosyltransferase involved in cell wall biosynthesis